MTRVVARFFSAVLVLAVFFLIVDPAAAQVSSAVRLVVTVADPSGLVVPGATVTVMAAGDATKTPRGGVHQTSATGMATIEGLAPGRYTIQAEFAGFETGTLEGVRLHAGDNRHLVVLPLRHVQDEVTVSRDRQAAAADPRARFGTALTRSEIEALSDDPAEMAQQLKEMAGPTAVLRVDSFEGGELPPKAQIKSIHITRDAFAAENHFAGHPFVDVITQPGVGAIRGGGNYRLRDGSLSARNPLTPTRGAEQLQAYGMNVGGSLFRDKSSFSLSVNGQTAYDSPSVFVALPGGGLRSEVLGVRRPVDNVTVSGLLDYALTRDQTLRLSVQRTQATSRNLGIGAQDEVDRAYSTESGGTLVRIQEAGPLGRRSFINTRLQVGRTGATSSSDVEAMTYQIAGARTTGGAQVSGGRHTTTVTLQSDVDYVRSVHSVRAGISLDGGSYRTNDSSNYLGTYFFESLAAFEQGRPRSYRRRIGDPNIQYANVQAGVYLQDDIRVRKNLTFSPGLRYELQTHVGDIVNLGPRAGVSWAPFKSGKTTVRGSWGIFYDWLGTGTYEQARRVDGFRQREIDIANPSFPDPGDVGGVTATNQYLLSSELPLARNVRLSAAIDQTISPTVRVTASYARQRGSGLLRGVNLNAPANGIRPDPAFVNIVEATGDAAARQHVFNASAVISLAAPSAAVRRDRFNWRRTSLNINYSTGKVENNTDGAFSLPASGSPDGEWAEVPHEIRRYRVNVGVNTSVVKNFNAAVTLNAMNGIPYTMTTGRDDNGDLVYNDRPAGVGRNTAWTPDFRTLNGTFSYVIAVGGRSGGRPDGPPIAAGRGAVAPGGDSAGRRVIVSASVNNLTNRANYSGYTGVMTSPFFRMPTAVMNSRKVEGAVSFSF